MTKPMSVCIALAFLAGCTNRLPAEQQEAAPPFQAQLAGDWFVAKQVVFDSKSEDEPSIRKLTFEANGIAKWYNRIDGGLVGTIGKYEIRQVEKQRHPDIVIMVREEKMAYPIVFIMKNIAIDFDSRFHMELVGKVLKFQHSNGKKYVFTRKKQEQQ